MRSAIKGPIRLFSTPSRAWAAVAVYTALLYSTLSLALRAYLWVFERLGEASVANLLNGIYVVLAAAFLLLVRPRRLGAYATLALVAVGLAYSFQQMREPANRMHFLQYGPLTLLAFDALRFHCRDRYRYIWTLLLVSCIGVGDETLQTFAGRQFDSRDLVLNSMAAVFVLAIIGFALEDGSFTQRRKVAKHAKSKSRNG